MNMLNNGQAKGQNAFQDQENELKKYLRILKKRKWFIILVALVIFVLWTIGVVLFGSKPTYQAATLLHFENTNQLSAVSAIGREGSGGRINESRVTILKTKNVIGPVVEELQLNLGMETDGVSRYALFDYTSVSSESVPGHYKIERREDGKYDLLFTDESIGVKDKHLLTFVPADTITVNKVTFKANERFLSGWEEKEVIFKVRPFLKAIDDVRAVFNHGWIDRRNATKLAINVTWTNPKMAADIANILTRKFIEFDLSLKNRKTEQQLDILENELRIAEADLQDANQKLQYFRERNPRVGTVGGGDAVTNITALQGQRSDIDTKINDLQGSLKLISNSDDLDQQLIRAREVLTILMAEVVQVAPAYEAEFVELSNKRAEVRQRFAPSHMEVTNNEKSLRGLISKIANEATALINKLENRRSSIGSKIGQQNYLIRSMPEKERAFADLNLDSQIKQGLYQAVLAKYNTAKIKKQVEVSDIQILEEAEVPPLKSTAKVILQKAILGIFFGLGLGVVLAVVLEFFDKTVQDSEDLQSRLKLPVLGNIPVINDDSEVPGNIKDIKGKRDTKLITLDYSPTLESESYRDLRTKIMFANPEKTLSSFLITSLRPGEGKSLTSSNLAITFAQHKISTLIIDADLRRGVLHNVYGNKKKPGLSDFLISKATVDYDNVNKLIQKTIIPNLYIITTGSPIPNPTEMLGSERMTNLLNVLKSRFGMVILDTAPFQASSDAPILSTHVDGLVVVVRADYTNVDQLKQKIQEYAHIQNNILGLVLNMVKVDMKKQRYQYSYYNY